MIPATDWKEAVPEGEAERFERHAEALRDMQRAAAAASGKKHRALHAKGLAGLEAELTVLPDLPDHARVGIFAAPAAYRAYVRFSNGSGLHQHDKKGDVRGVAIKVVGVPGKKIIPGLEDARTADFLLIKSAATPFRNADEFLAVVRAAASPLSGFPRLIGQVGFGRALGLLRKLAAGLGEPVTSLATTRFYSALPIKFGPHAVHYALAPHAAPDPTAKPGTSRHYLGEEIAERLRGGPVTYDFRVQFYRDAALTPIEDASVEWQEKDAPFVTLARLVLPKQDPSSPRGQRVAEMVERFSFDPWHTTEDFRPLGNMMRARNHAYRLSTQERAAEGEPDGSEILDP
jgi:hypothetical protein